MFRFLIDSTPLEVSVKDILFVAVAVLGCLLGLYFIYFGIRKVIAPTHHEVSERPRWGPALFLAVMGVVMIASFVVELRHSAGEDPNTLKTVRTTAGAHAWSIRLFLGGAMMTGVGFILGALPPTVAAWLRQRRRRARGEPDPEIPPFARPRRRGRPRRRQEVQASRPRRQQRARGED